MTLSTKKKNIQFTILCFSLNISIVSGDTHFKFGSSVDGNKC